MAAPLSQSALTEAGSVATTVPISLKTMLQTLPLRSSKKFSLECGAS
jgi:hypothetical protein